MRQVRVELSRLRSRRAVVLLVVVAALLVAFLAGTTLWDTRPASGSELASARAQVAEQVAGAQFRADVASCRKDPQQMFGDGATPADCAGLAPSVQDYVGRSELSLSDQLGGGGISVSVLLAVLMIVAGATFAGADWATGSMSNQLLFQPRRLRVWVAKAVAVAVVAAVVSAVLVTAYWATLALVASARGLDTPAGVLRDAGWLGARGVALAACGALGGYALTMLLRSTVATLGLLFAYAAGGEALLAALPLDRPARWSPTTNVFAWLQDGVRVFDPTATCAPGASCDQRYTVGLAHGAAYLGVLLVLAAVVSLVSFRRRDVP